MEQCSSELTAEYKSSLVKGKTLIDLTGGMGVDTAFLSDNFEKTFYVEMQEELCEIAKHNFKVLNKNIEVVNDKALSLTTSIFLFRTLKLCFAISHNSSCIST